MPERPPSTPTRHLYTCVHTHRYARPYSRTHIPTNSGTRLKSEAVFDLSRGK